ncbi:MAG TPA: hypothetical protein VHM28_07875 [Anaerolineales bacterium]|nr:hypothetical protein [Anaerolineales bacterium]
MLLLFQMSLASCNQRTAHATSVSQETSFTGTVFIVAPGPAIKPWAIHVELRKADGSTIDSDIDMDLPAKFSFKNIPAATYQLWVLIPSYTLENSNCYDIGLPNSAWKLGKILNGNQVEFIEGITYRDAFFQAVNRHSSQSSAYDFYAVLQDLEIRPGLDNNIDVSLICKSS